MSDLGRWLLRHHGALTGIALLSAVLLPALLAPWLPLADPTLTEPTQRMLPIGALGHPFGTDALGRDLLSRLVWGARSSILVGLLATLVAMLVGTVIGILAAVFGRLADTLLMRGVDVLMAFPYLLLALAIVAALGPGLANAMLAIAVANVPFFARAVRGAVLEIRHQAYIDAARLAGHRVPWIIGIEILPNLVPTLLLLVTTTLGWMVLETAGLSFLGLGAQPPDADLGAMLGEGRAFLTTYPRVAVLPGLVILVLVLGINLLGDAVRDLLDPRLRALARARSPARTAPPLRERRAGRAAGPSPCCDAAAVAQPLRPGGPDGPCEQGLDVRGLSVLVPGEVGLSVAVDRLDLKLDPGERVGLVGESGSGKSLTALALLGFAPSGGALTGRVRLRGVELLSLRGEALREQRGRRVAYIPQQPADALHPLLRVGDQVGEAVGAHADGAGAPAPAAVDQDTGGAAEASSARLTRRRIAARVKALFAMVGLDRVADIQRRFPHELSGGQCQRVAIAMALAHEPDLLIADEATTALDVTVQAEIMALLGRLCRGEKHMLLFVSHDLALVTGLCERVLVLYAGRLIEDAPRTRLLTAPAHPYTAALLACAPVLGQPGKPLAAIPGQPPSPDACTHGAVASGCRFAPRCPRVQPVCRQAEPALQALAPGHRVRCLFPDQPAQGHWGPSA